jgi:asparagine synthase (glutamine-hydrolysing)
MMYSRELREPFLDHRLVELGLRQPAGRKIRDGVGKWLPRQIAKQLVPGGIREAPKRPVQTPQREWLRGPLRDWVEAQLEVVLGEVGSDWFDTVAMKQQWTRYQVQGGDNSFFLWQWVNLGLMLQSQGVGSRI